MKPARIAVLGVALGAGLVAAYLALNLASPPPAETPVAVRAPAALDSQEVLVARRDIPMGDKLTPDSVEWRAWPESGVSPNFLVRSADPEAIDTVVSAIARSTFFAGEPIIDAKLIRSDRGYMSAILPAGKVAVATRISADTSAGGFILPNDRVDVIMTRQSSGEGAAPYLTETILNDVRVLAIDQQIEDVNGEKVVVGQTATLELTPEQAKILTVAQQMSDRLTLALRSIADAEAGPRSSDAYHLIGGRTGTVTVVKNGVVREVNGVR